MRQIRPLLEGSATGQVLVLQEPLSFWGGVDPVTGSITDASHPQLGETVTGRLLVMPHGRGSSSSSSVLAESLRLGTGPAAILLAEPDPILLIGALVANSLYGSVCPIMIGDFAELTDGEWSLEGDVIVRLD